MLLNWTLRGRLDLIPSILYGSPMSSSISVVDLRRAITLREKIEAMQSELAAILGGSSSPRTIGRPKGSKTKRAMSAATKAKMAAAAKARWKKAKAAGKTTL